MLTLRGSDLKKRDDYCSILQETGFEKGAPPTSKGIELLHESHNFAYQYRLSIK